MTSESAAPLFIFTQPEVLWYTIARESRRGALSRVRQESGTVELEQAKKRVEELRAVIEKSNRLYYDQNAPELEDFEYDALTRELKELEAQYPRVGHSGFAHPACRRHPQWALRKSDTCCQDGKFAGCIFLR